MEQVSVQTPVISLLRKIENLQTKTDNTYYQTGLFPSQRFIPFLGYTREDNNIFFSATITFILQSLESSLEKEELEISKKIIESVLRASEGYLNKTNFVTYNFWDKDISSSFPNGYLLNKIQHFKIPDDFDVTCLLFLTKEHKQEDRLNLLEILQSRCNNVYKKVKAISNKYKMFDAYTTFHVDKMSPELDFAVICNILCFTLQFDNLSKYDNDSIRFLERCIISDDIWKKPQTISMSYPSSAILMYHLSRLMAAHQISILENYKTEIIKETQKAYQKEKNTFNQLLYAISLIKFGVTDQSTTITGRFRDKKSWFFVANMLAPYNNRVLIKLFSPHFLMKFKCSALIYTLMLENAVLTRKIK